MTEKEIETFLKKDEVVAYLKKNIQLDLNVEACESIYGYDITATVSLNNVELAKETDCI
jgi:hypothetical protein